MKQLKLTGFVIFLFFLTECLSLPTKPQDVDDFNITQKFIEDNVGYITIITFAQYVQEASFEEVEMLAKTMTEYRDQCLANSKLPQCSKLPNDALQEAICAMEGVPQKHNFSHCCNKGGFERRLCFFFNKKADVGFLPPLPTLDPEVKCQAYENNSKSFLSKYIAILSQKFPKTEFEELIPILEDVSSNYDECCEGDAVQCIRGRSKVMSHICSKQDSISSKIKECCEKKIPERGECIIQSKDDKPKDLSLKEDKFTENKNVCEERNADEDTFMAKFLYEYSRRHQELSTPELLRIARVYDDLLRECCNTENPPDCYSTMENKFNETTEKSLKIVQRECEHFQNLGKDDLKYHYFIKFTKIAPQLSTDELTFLGEEMVTALLTCCTLSEEFACVDNLVDLVIGEICGVNGNRTINPAVDHCCKTNFAFRRHCFEALEADKTYVPPSASQGLFTFHTDLCHAHNEELQRKKDRFLVNLVKLKPELTDEELRSSLTGFTNLVDKCCKAEGPEACFNEEGPKLAAKNQAS
ncbi:afamin isoform X2 [Myotis yumanensis]|uniref:afamin isoform X2 n=1 Tax=Myotis yumanensis TaxID=159337 RepID=UPI0038CFBCE3